MALLRRILSRTYRQALSAEGAGRYREAAAFYAEAGLPDRAASALLYHAARAPSLEERLDAYRDALRWIPEASPRRLEVEAQIGLAILDDAQRRGALSTEERRRLEDGAARLERAERFAEAATAHELLGHTDAMARCLERGGEIERLERLLERTSQEDARERRLRGLLQEHELALRVGARLDARQALRAALELAPQDATLVDLRARLERRWPASGRVRLLVDRLPVEVVGRLPASLGRADADVVLRGASVSRRHAELAMGPQGLVVRDLGARNGTLVRGLPIAGELLLGGETEIGLGDDVALRVTRAGERALLLEVLRGLDTGARVLVGEGMLSLPGVPAILSFPDGHATLEATDGETLALDGQPCAYPVQLLVGDAVALGAHRVEVVP